MCRIPRVVVVADPSRHLELRRALSSLEYDIVATLPAGQPLDLTADVVLIENPSAQDLQQLRSGTHKIVAVCDDEVAEADLTLPTVQLREFRTRVWEVLRARP